MTRQHGRRLSGRQIGVAVASCLALVVVFWFRRRPGWVECDICWDGMDD